MAGNSIATLNRVLPERQHLHALTATAQIWKEGPSTKGDQKRSLEVEGQDPSNKSSHHRRMGDIDHRITEK